MYSYCQYLQILGFTFTQHFIDIQEVVLLKSREQVGVDAAWVYLIVARTVSMLNYYVFPKHFY